MNTIRRLYFYALALVSALVVIWGSINLLRTVLIRRLEDSGSVLASGLALVLVGAPIFLLHWQAAQRDAARSPEEHTSRIRAVFLYTALGSTLGPVVYAVIALMDRAAVALLRLPATEVWFGRGSTPADNGIALAINLAAAFYFWTVVRSDWSRIAAPVNLRDARRLYRYVWLTASLFLSIAGVYNLLNFALGPDLPERGDRLAAGIALLAVGALILAYTWRLIQSSLEEPAELGSQLRLVVLYAILLGSVVGVLSAAGSILNLALQWVFGSAYTAERFLIENRDQVSLLVPVAVTWWFFGSTLTREVESLSDPSRRSALRRLYSYILCALGLAVAYSGMIALAGWAAQELFPSMWYSARETRSEVSGALSAVLVGLPLWLVPWRRMQSEAARAGDAGDHARRSVLRKAYLYLVLFAMVIGAMFFTGVLLYTVFEQLISPGSLNDFRSTITSNLLALAFDASLLVYHLRALRADSRMAQRSLAGLHASFPLLVLDTEENGSLSASVEEALRYAAPTLPVTVRSPDQPLEVSAVAARAVVMPLSLALNPPAAWKDWLAGYPGRRIIVPQPVEGWTWVGQADRLPQELARDTANAVRQLAEGESVRRSFQAGPWGIAGYVLGGLAGLSLLSVLFSILMSSLFR